MRSTIWQKGAQPGSLQAGDIIEIDDFQAAQLVALGVAEAVGVLPPKEPQDPPKAARKPPKAAGKPPKAADKP